MRNDLISVIIPAYNSEQYILRCLDSVFNQTYKNIEIIVVNDGSTDKTREIVEQLDNVILLNKENGGLCSSRKYGVKNSKGKYIIFLDSDDYLESDFIEKLYSETSGRSDELIMCGFITNGIKDNVGSNRLCAEGRESIYNLFLHKGILNKTPNKLYPVEMITDECFPIGRDMLEDAYFTAHILENCNKVIKIPYCGYNYIKHEGSLSKKRHNKIGVAGAHSNTLEKDIMLSKYISVSEYNFFSNILINDLKRCFNGNKDLSLFNLSDKLFNLVSFLLVNEKSINDKSVNLFANIMSKAKTTKQLKRRFATFTLFHDSFRNKKAFIRSLLRKILKSY